MDPLLAEDLTHLPELLEMVRRYAARGLAGLDARPAAIRPHAAKPAPMPENPSGLRAALELFAERWEPGFSASAGPRYLGFVTGGVTPAALAGDWLAATWDQNVMSGLDSSAPDLEREALTWLRDLLGLPPAHSGAFVTGATMSNFTGLAVAREWLGERAGVSVAESGIGAIEPVHVLSGCPHSSVYKSLSMLGIGRDRLRTVALLPGRESVDVARLATALEELDGHPAIVVANAGTVNTGDFDDLRAIAALRRNHDFWLHVDGAFGAFAALAPGHAHLVDGIGMADSVCVDLHKWLNVPYDGAVQFTRRRDLQSRVFANAATYLGEPGDHPDFVHLTPENSRRLRALAAWFSLVAYGRAGHTGIVRQGIELARLLAGRIAELPGLRLLAPVRLNVVCFTVTDEPTEERVHTLARRVTDGGEAFITPTVYGGVPALRAAFSSWRTGRSDVERVTRALQSALNDGSAPPQQG